MRGLPRYGAQPGGALMPGKQKGVLYACIKLCFWRDKRFIRAGIDGMGYYSAALCWLREDQTNDAVLPFDRVGDPGMVGQDAGLAFCRRLCAPDVGLFRETANGFTLLRYEDCNELGKDIETRRKAVAVRVTKHRSNKDVTRYSDVTERACNADVPVSVSVSLSSGSPSPSLPVGLILETEPPVLTPSEPKPKRVSKADRAIRATRCPAGDDAGLPEWLRAHGIPPIDLPGVEDFLDYHRAGKGREKGLSLDWAASWRTWQRNAVKFMLADEERKAAGR